MTAAETSILGLSETLSLLIVGGVIGAVFLVAVVVGWIWWDDHRPIRDATSHPDPSRDLDAGILLVMYASNDDLASVAAQRGILPNPVWVERGEGSEKSSEAGASGKGLLLKRGKRQSSDTREHFDLPPDTGSLVRSVLKRLIEGGELDQSVADAPYVGSNQHPLLADPGATEKFIKERLNGRYPDGIDDSWDDVIHFIVASLQRQALEESVNQKRHHFDGLSPDQFVLAESLWRVHRRPESVLLRLAEWQPVPYVEGEQVLAVPEGVGVSVTLALGGLTERGATNLLDGESRRLGVYGTVQRFVQSTNRLEVSPIAVFSRTGHVGHGRRGH